MKKLTVGRKRKTQIEISRDHTVEGNLMFILGLAIICVMLSLPMVRAEEGDKISYGDAVPVMSGGVVEREELSKPVKDTSAAERWSIYDYIGELFAELITGSR